MHVLYTVRVVEIVSVHVHVHIIHTTYMYVQCTCILLFTCFQGYPQESMSMCNVLVWFQAELFL